MPKDYSGKEPIGWFTVKGVHIPILEGETKDDAINRLRREMLYNQSMSDTDYKKFGSPEKAYKSAQTFMKDEDNSNFSSWVGDLTDDERWGISYYTDEDYTMINNNLYQRGYNKLDSVERQDIDNIDKAIEKFVLFKPIQVTRIADVRMFGFKKGDTPSQQKIIDKLIQTHGHLEYPAYLSSSCDNSGRAVNAAGVVVHIGVPSGKGIGAYIAHNNLSPTPTENEFLFARNTVLKYDISSLKKKGGMWEINAEWVMTAPDKED